MQDALVAGVAASRIKPLAAADVPMPDPPGEHVIFYNQPAATWPDALPVGNGRLGAMVFGLPQRERIQLNEETVWMGGARDRNNPQAARTSEVRSLLMAGKVHEAEALAAQVMMGVPDRLPCYQTLGDLWLELEGVPAEVQNYRLELNLNKAVVKTRFLVGDVVWTREIFSSAPENLIAVRLECSQPMRLKVKLDRPAHAETKAVGNDHLVMMGQALPVKPTTDPATQEHQVGVRFRAELKAVAESGRVRADSDALLIEGAHVVLLYLTAATDYRENDAAGMTAACARRLEAAAAMDFETLHDRHVADYRRYADRAEIQLSEDADSMRDIPTDRRIQRVKEGSEDLGLISTYFAYGRYMLISSSRPGTLPANLQGIWNESLDPPWGSKYTVNINAEMNYWLAEPTNLADLHPQLFDLLDRTRPQGAVTAKKYYNARGFVVHHNTDIWGDPIPVDHVQAGVWAMGAAWMSLHLFSHYAFSGDTDFLRRRAYPRIKEIAEFLLDYLVEAPDGTLVSGPSQSPENKYKLPDGSTASLCMSPAMDTEIIRAVFDRVARMSVTLGVDVELRAQVQAASKRLPSLKIGGNGALQEWNEDYAETEPGHRHISHLFALYPDHQITLRETPELAQAARKVLERRLANGGGSTGWSRAWIINCWARLEDGEAAYESVLALLRSETRGNLFDICGMKANSPFQIDGNLGGAAGIAEMLIQSHGGVVRLLPALPRAWASGHFRGLRARDGVEVDCAWTGGRITSATLKGSIDRELTIHAMGQIPTEARSGDRRIPIGKMKGGNFNMRVEAGKNYLILFS